MNLLSEFNAVVHAISNRRLRYLLVGGLALAVHGFGRATKDIDFLVHPDDVEKFRTALRRIGYSLAAPSMTFKSSGMVIHRVMKPSADDETLFVVDLLVSQSPDVLDMLKRPQRERWGTGSIRLIRKMDLIKMKRSAGRPQDVEDARRLEQSGE